MSALSRTFALILCLTLPACDTGALPPVSTAPSSLDTAQEKTEEPTPNVHASAAQTQVLFLNGRVSVIANDTPQLALLAQLAKQAGFGLDLFHRDWTSLTLSFNDVPLERALGYILADTPYEILYNTDNSSEPPLINRVRVGQVPVDDEYRAKTLAALNNTGFNITPSLDMAVSMEQVLALSDQEKITLLSHLSPSSKNLPILLDFLTNHTDSDIRIAAMAALENADAPQALDAIVKVLNDPDPQMVLAAIDSIEFAGNVEQIFALEALSQHPSKSVQQAAAEAIDFLR